MYFKEIIRIDSCQLLMNAIFFYHSIWGIFLLRRGRDIKRKLVLNQPGLYHCGIKENFIVGDRILFSISIS